MNRLPPPHTLRAQHAAFPAATMGCGRTAFRLMYRMSAVVSSPGGRCVPATFPVLRGSPQTSQLPVTMSAVLIDWGGLYAAAPPGVICMPVRHTEWRRPWGGQLHGNDLCTAADTAIAAWGRPLMRCAPTGNAGDRSARPRRQGCTCGQREHLAVLEPLRLPARKPCDCA